MTSPCLLRLSNLHYTLFKNLMALLGHLEKTYQQKLHTSDMEAVPFVLTKTPYTSTFTTPNAKISASNVTNFQVSLN